MTTTLRSFLGIPVEGDIVRNKPEKEQRPLAELSPLLQAVLDDPHVTEFGWRQYTPYFNDGEPCVFGVNGLWVRTDADDPDDDPDELECSSFSRHPTLGKDVTREPWQEGLARNAAALDTALDDGEFDEVLLEAFGDHAEITVRRTGITIDSYEHD